MQWGVSEKVLEEMILSDKWTTMSESDVEVFLATPGIGVVEAKGTLQESHGNVPVDLKGTQTSNPDAESMADVAGPDEQNISGDLDVDLYGYFDEIIMDDEFVIHSDPKYYSVYDRFYTCNFCNDLFF